MIALLKKEFKEQIRSGRFWIILAVFGFFAIMSPVSAFYMPQIIAKATNEQGIEIKVPDPVWMDAMIQYFKNISQICTFIVILLLMGSVCREKENGNVVFILVKPVSRISFILSKIVVAFILILLSFIVSFLITSFYTWLLFGSFPIKIFALSNLPAIIQMLFIVVMTIMFSTLAKSQFVAALFTFLAWLIFGLSGQWGKTALFTPVKLNQESMNILQLMELSWQPFAGAVFFIALFTLISIFVFQNYEPKN